MTFTFMIEWKSLGSGRRDVCEWSFVLLHLCLSAANIPLAHLSSERLL